MHFPDMRKHNRHADTFCALSAAKRVAKAALQYGLVSLASYPSLAEAIGLMLAMLANTFMMSPRSQGGDIKSF